MQGEKAALSAKWRRNKKDSGRFNIFKIFNKAKDKPVPRTFRVKGSGAKWRASRSGYKLKDMSEGRLKEPQPLIDVLEENDEIAVLAEFAGFNRENLRINIKNQKLILSAKASERKYYKSLNLPKRVIPETISTTYKNGVLEIRLKKALEKEAIDNIAG
jgi:HSP20 family molecular chaperone IbpA